MKRNRETLRTDTETTLEQIAQDCFGNTQIAMLLETINGFSQTQLLPKGTRIVLPLPHELDSMKKSTPAVEFDPSKGAGTTTKRKWAQMRASQRTNHSDSQEPYRLTELFLGQGLSILAAAQRLRTLCPPEQLRPFLDDDGLSVPEHREVAFVCRLLENREILATLTKRLHRLFEETSSPNGRHKVLEAAAKDQQHFVSFFSAFLFPRQLLQDLAAAAPAAKRRITNALFLEGMDPAARLFQIEEEYGDERDIYLSLVDIASNDAALFANERLTLLGIKSELEKWESHIAKILNLLDALLLEIDSLDASIVHALVQGKALDTFSQQHTIIARLLSHFSQVTQNENVDAITQGLGDFCLHLQQCSPSGKRTPLKRGPPPGTLTAAALAAKVTRKATNPQNSSEVIERVARTMERLFESLHPSPDPSPIPRHLQQKRRARVENIFYARRSTTPSSSEIQSQATALLRTLEKQDTIDGCIKHSNWTPEEKQCLETIASTLTGPLLVHMKNTSAKCRVFLLFAFALDIEEGHKFVRMLNQPEIVSQIMQTGGRVVSLCIENYSRGVR